ncbi:hypothetical protein P4521_12905, partial [Geobacillus stearothermophilus]|uniref:hypothetical protein n=2 Tax=Geobacillus stearothermophilus TaxID=1422 RepID=UPI002E1FD44A|nr:hypothetical protein [Geobacillus stearothermophilus]
MDKKKAVKLATASAVAASAFVAANPHASQAATDVATVVSQAKAQMKEAYYTYSHTVTETGQFPDIKDVYAAYNKAKQAYANAVAVVNKAGGAKKDAYLADLQATYETYVFKANPKSGEARVATYIDAYNYATKLDKMRQELKAAVDAKDLKKAEELYHKISYELKTRTVILDRVYGQSTRELLRSTFKADAQALRDSLIYDITVAMKAREAQDAVKAGNLDKAKAALDQVNQYVSKVTDAFKAELQKAAQDAKAAYEAALTPKVESVSAIGAKKLEVKFNKAVDTTKATFEVKKGSVKVNTETITFNNEKTAAVIELTGKLTAGEYTVNVTGLTDQVLTATTTVENERVETVKILSENAVLNKNGENVTVGYKVENQYGEDITATTALTATAAGTVVNGKANPSKGVVTIPVKDGVKEGDSIVLTLVHAASGKSASATVKVSPKAQVSEIAITGLYNKDGKALTETTDLSKDAFYLLVEGKDQYGNVVDEAALDASNAVLINNTNPLIVKVATDFETIKVNGKDVTALRLNGPVTAGETTVMLISTASGKNATFKVKVAESQRTDTVTFEVPDLVVANEKLFVPIQVLDKEGNLVTDEKVLNDATRGIKVSGLTNAVVKKVDGKIGVEVPAENVKEGYISLVAVSSTGKSTIANIQVKAEAKPVRVEGVTSDIKTTVLTGSRAQTLFVDNVKIIDQYEREMSAAQKAKYFTGQTPKYSLVIKDEKQKPEGNAGAVNIIDGNKIVPIAKGTEKVTISIKDEVKDEVLTGSEKSVTFRVTDGTEYKSYEVKSVGTVYDEVAAGKTDNNAYDKAVEVYGVLDDGSKVKLTHGVDYTVSSTNATFNTDVADGTIDVDKAFTYGKDETEIKLPLTVTINATGEKLTQEVTISKETPKVTKLEVVANGKATDLAAGKTVAALENVSYDAAKVNAPFDFSVLARDVADIVVTDQYGVRVVLTGSNNEFPDGTKFVSTLTFNKVDGELVFVNNGTASAKVTEIPKDSVFNVVVSAGTLTAGPVKVTATSAYSSAQAAEQKAGDKAAEQKAGDKAAEQKAGDKAAEQ